jgi:hypothetical protein
LPTPHLLKRKPHTTATRSLADPSRLPTKFAIIHLRRCISKDINIIIICQRHTAALYFAVACDILKQRRRSLQVADARLTNLPNLSMPSEAAASSPLHTHLERFLTTRHSPKTFCPSEVARALSTNELSELGFETWRDAMPEVRRLVYDLRDEGGCEVLQKGEVITAAESDVTGPIRVRRTGDDAT